MHKKAGQNSAKNIMYVISRPTQVYSGFKVFEHISLTVSMKVFMNNITIFQVNEVYKPNGVQGRPPTEGRRGQPVPHRIFIFKGALVESV